MLKQGCLAVLAKGDTHVAKAWFAAALLLAACSGDGSSYSPTQPITPAPPSPTALWYGSWFFDHATPAGDCLADAMNAWRPGWAFTLAFQPGAGLVHLQFSFAPGFEDQEGFWPAEFTGSVGPDGAVIASVPAARLGTLRSDPWMELCYGYWWMQGGQLSANLSPDGRTIAGTIVESFRVETGATFTINSHFTAMR